MNSTILKTSGFYITFISLIALLISCGSSVDNPTSPSDNEENQTDELGELMVEVEIHPDDGTVELTATVEPVKSNQLFFKWVNVTGYGELSNTDQASTIWTAPTGLEEDDVKVAVIHLVVIAVSQTISVTDSKVNTDTEIYTKTKTIPLTVRYRNGKLEVDVENE